MKVILFGYLLVSNFLLFSQNESKMIKSFGQQDFNNYRVKPNQYNFWWHKHTHKWFPKKDTLAYFVDDRGYKGILNYGIKIALVDRKNYYLTENHKMYYLNIYVKKCKFNPKDSIVEIEGVITGGISNKYTKNNVSIFLGKKKDTVNKLYLDYLHDQKEFIVTKKGEKVTNHIVLDSFPSFYMYDYVYKKTNYGEKRSFIIKGKVDENSLIVFGVESSFSEIFDIGKMIYAVKNHRKNNNKHKKNPSAQFKVIIQNNKQISNKESLLKPDLLNYYKIAEKAEKYILRKQYGKAKQEYDLLIKERKYIFARDIHNAIRCAILARDVKKAIFWCEKIALKGVSLAYYNDAIFDKIKKNALWKIFVKKHKLLNDKFKKGLNHTLINGINILVAKDQNSYGGKDNQLERVKITESIDAELVKLIKEEGFPSEEKIGIALSQDNLVVKTMPKYFVLFVHSYKINNNRVSDLKKMIINWTEKFEYDFGRDNLGVYKKNGNTCLQIYKGNLYNNKTCDLNTVQIKKITFTFHNQYNFIIDRGEYAIMPYEAKNEINDDIFIKEQFDLVKKLTDDWFFYEK